MSSPEGPGSRPRSNGMLRVRNWPGKAGRHRVEGVGAQEPAVGEAHGWGVAGAWWLFGGFACVRLRWRMRALGIVGRRPQWSVVVSSGVCVVVGCIPHGALFCFVLNRECCSRSAVSIMARRNVRFELNRECCSRSAVSIMARSGVGWEESRMLRDGNGSHETCVALELLRSDKRVDGWQVGGSPIEFSEVMNGNPSQLVVIGACCGIGSDNCCPVRRKIDRNLADSGFSPRDELAELDCDIQFLADLANESRLGSFSWLDLSARKLPFSCSRFSSGIAYRPGSCFPR